MVRQDARFHLAMLLAQYSNAAANRFDVRFDHQERVRSSNRIEMQELNEWWSVELRPLSPKASRNALRLDTESGIDSWIDQFEKTVLREVITLWF